MRPFSVYMYFNLKRLVFRSLEETLFFSSCQCSGVLKRRWKGLVAVEKTRFSLRFFSYCGLFTGQKRKSGCRQIRGWSLRAVGWRAVQWLVRLSACTRNACVRCHWDKSPACEISFFSWLSVAEGIWMILAVVGLAFWQFVKCVGRIMKSLPIIWGRTGLGSMGRFWQISFQRFLFWWKNTSILVFIVIIRKVLLCKC